MPQSTLQFLLDEHQAYCNWALEQLPDLDAAQAKDKEQRLMLMAQTMAAQPLIAQALPQLVHEEERALAAWLAIFASDSVALVQDSVTAFMVDKRYAAVLQGEAAQSQLHSEDAGGEADVIAKGISALLQAYSFVGSDRPMYASDAADQSPIPLKQLMQQICQSEAGKPAIADYLQILLAQRDDDAPLMATIWQRLSTEVSPSWHPLIVLLFPCWIRIKAVTPLRQLLSLAATLAQSEQAMVALLAAQDREILPQIQAHVRAGELQSPFLLLTYPADRAEDLVHALAHPPSPEAQQRIIEACACYGDPALMLPLYQLLPRLSGALLIAAHQSMTFLMEASSQTFQQGMQLLAELKQNPELTAADVVDFWRQQPGKIKKGVRCHIGMRFNLKQQFELAKQSEHRVALAQSIELMTIYLGQPLHFDIDAAFSQQLQQIAAIEQQLFSQPLPTGSWLLWGEERVADLVD